MAIHCFGSINIDHVHRVPHFPVAGETLADQDYAAGLGGKGANQALAAAAAGADVRMIGAIGADGTWATVHLSDKGIDISGVAISEQATGHAVIFVSPEGENQIVIHGGANQCLTQILVDKALSPAKPGDWWLCQNETNLVADAARLARAEGLKIAYAAAPFEAAPAAEMLPLADLIAVNAGEAAALAAHFDCPVEDLPVPALLITMGGDGARYLADGAEIRVPAFPVTPLDTTGAGDTFLGTLLSGFDTGLVVQDAMIRAAAAAALQVTRKGAGEAIPSAAEVDALIKVSHAN